VLARPPAGRYRPVDEERTDLEVEGEPDHGSRTSGDPEERPIPPAEEPQATEGAGTTAAEQRDGGDLDRRLEEEEPEASEGLRERARRLREGGSGLTDLEKDLVADEAEAVSGPAAEEDALRVEEDQAPGGTEGPDRYVEDETGGP
jgi:hypothetical protein